MTSARPYAHERLAIEPLELTEAIGTAEVPLQPEVQPDERPDEGRGGRRVLATVLVLLAILWIGLSAWQAGKGALGTGDALSAFSLATGPLVVLGLVWLIFGRTRRREAERFTRSVQTMQAEARSLEQLLGILRQRLDE